MGTALITGGTAGLGLEFAWQLATARHNLVLVARDEERLNAVADQLRAASGVTVEILCADLAKTADVNRVVRRLKSSGEDGTGPVGLLVNNAGFGTSQPFAGGDLRVETKALDVMVRATMVLTHAALPGMVERGRGAILNVGSIAALTASGTYSAHKAWVRTFTEGLAVELAGTGVTATAVAPGLTRTEFHQRASLDADGFPDIAWLDAHQVVAEALEAVRRGVVLVTPSLRYKLTSALLRAAPRPIVRLLGSPGLTPRSAE
jgi:short-subunit dehydrogenase